MDYITGSTHLKIYQQVEPISLKGSDNFITIVSDRVTDLSDFKYNVKLGTLRYNESNGFHRLEDYSEFDILPNPNSFLINSPNPFMNIDEELKVNDIITKNENYRLGIYEVKEKSDDLGETIDDIADVIFSKPFFLISGEDIEEDFNYEDYILNSVNSKMLTDYEEHRYFNNESNNIITIFNGSGYTYHYSPIYNAENPFRTPDFDLEINNNNDRIYLEVWDNDGSRFRCYFENPYKDTNDLLLNLNVSKDNLRNQVEYKTEVYNGSWTSVSETLTTSDDVITDTTKKFYVYTSDSSDNITSKKYLFKRVECDNILNDKQILWINRLGGVESYIFKGYKNKSTEVEKDFYSNSKYNIDFTTGELDRGFYDRDKKVSSKSRNIKYTITSKYKSTTEGQLFNDLINSNNVYLYENDNIIPIIIDTDNISFGDRDIDGMKIFNFEFTKNIRKKYKR